MNTILWICQGLLLLVFFFSGVTKSTLPQRKLVDMGQTGVEGLPLPLVRFIGIAELAGSVGIIVPWFMHTLPVLTPLAAAGFAIIMVLAARVHYRRNELQTVGLNVVILALALFVAFGRGITGGLSS